MTLEQLINVDVSSVTKTSEPLNTAPAAVYVITHDAIMRSGAVTVPEMLRLAPNLFVARTGASSYTITARGFSGNPNFQQFANKLLVLIDGRTVYTPLYAGVYWDMQDVLAEDIDRIEVISGPGATLWGANAVNGVINIITKGTAATQGGSVTAEYGTVERSVSARYGGKIGANLTYRLYAKLVDVRQSRTVTGAKAGDAFQRTQGGFRVDWTPSATDLVTVQGDRYAGANDQNGAPDEDISGGNALLRWRHDWSGSSNLQVQAYYDHAHRGVTPTGLAQKVDTYDLAAQQGFDLGSRQSLIAGAGIRFARYVITSKPNFFFVPPQRTLTLANAFLQDSIRLSNPLRLILGLKVEDNPYSGVALLPSARLSWTPKDKVLLWAAVSRAIRSPTPLDRDVVEKVGATTFVVGNGDFEPETLIAYEAGTRLQLSPRTSVSVSAFYNDYDQLKNIETTSGHLPLVWGNALMAHTYGFEAWGDHSLADWWRVSASFAYLHKDISFERGSSRLGGVVQVGDDPKYRATLRSTMNLVPGVTLDADLRYVAKLPDPKVPSYVELNGRVGWQVSDGLQLSLVGLNLLHKRHLEFPGDGRNSVSRSIAGTARWQF